jgi:hypothetical protein
MQNQSDPFGAVLGGVAKIGMTGLAGGIGGIGQKDGFWGGFGGAFRK